MGIDCLCLHFPFGRLVQLARSTTLAGQLSISDGPPEGPHAQNGSKQPGMTKNYRNHHGFVPNLFKSRDYAGSREEKYGGALHLVRRSLGEDGSPSRLGETWVGEAESALGKNGCHRKEGDQNFQGPPTRSSYGGQARHPKLVSLETA